MRQNTHFMLGGGRLLSPPQFRNLDLLFAMKDTERRFNVEFC